MFEDSLIESGGKLKTKRGWTSIVSFAIQMGIIGVMVLIPLIFTEALPKGQDDCFSGGPPAAATASSASRCGRCRSFNRSRPTSSTANCARLPRFPRKLK